MSTRMTNKERIVKTLRGETTDRVPFVSWLGFSPWEETRERWRRESGLTGITREEYFGLQPFFQVVPAEYGPLPHFEPTTILQDTEFVIFTDWRGITMRNRRDGGSMPEWLGHPIRSRADWERYKAERLQPRLEERLAGFDAFLRKIDGLDAPLQVGRFPWGVFGTARDLLGAEELLVAFYDEPEMVRDIMETNVALWLAIYEKVAERVHIDHIHIWEDMASKQGSLISPDMIEEFMMPCYDRIADFARAHDVPLISVDSDGDCRQLVPVMMKHGVNVFMPFEVQAGCDIEEYRRLYPELGIIGGLDKRALAAGKAEIDLEVRRAARMCEKGRYIPGFDHAIPPDVSWKNYEYAMKELKRVCGFE